MDRDVSQRRPTDVHSPRLIRFHRQLASRTRFRFSQVRYHFHLLSYSVVI
jgi:hypothetical protein